MPFKRSYLVYRGIVRVFTHSMKTVWDVPYDGKPCVFCPNHAGAMGPIDMMAHFELCDDVRPWFNAAVADRKQVPAYVRQDYWWRPGCRLEPLFNATLPYLAALVLPPVMNSVEGVPVYHDMQVLKTFRKSIEYLKGGHPLVIFPQQPSGYKSHHMWINRGFLQIAPMALRTLKQPLNFYPVYIDNKTHVIHVKKPIPYDPDRTLAEQEEELLAALAEGLRS